MEELRERRIVDPRLPRAYRNRTLLLALQRTLEFEEEIAEKFGGGSHNKESGSETGEDMGKTNQTVVVA
ncbi:hypothetical protein ACS0TY_006649 [Phlomoides rotata]